MIDRAIQAVCAVLMTLAAICFAGMTALMISVNLTATSNLNWGVVFLFAFLTVISVAIAFRLWRPVKGAPAIIPIWAIRATGVFMMCGTIAMVIAGRPSIFLTVGTTVFIGMIFAHRLFEEAEVRP